MQQRLSEELSKQPKNKLLQINLYECIIKITISGDVRHPMKIYETIDINTLYKIEHISKFTSITRGLTLIASIVFLIWFIIPIVFGILNIGNIFGILLCAYFIFMYGFRRTFLRIKHNFSQNSFLSVCWHGGKIVIIAFLIYAAVITAFMFIVSFIPPVPNSTAIVLGCQVNYDKPSMMLQERIDAAANYMIDNRDARLIASGGLGEGDRISEAECIINELEDDHINRTRMYKEDNSYKTSENIENSILIIENYKLEPNVAIVTDFFHQLRVRLILQSDGYEGNIGAINAETNIFFAPTYIVREWFAIPKELFLS